MPKHQRKTNRPKGISKKWIRKMNTAYRIAEKKKAKKAGG